MKDRRSRKGDRPGFSFLRTAGGSGAWKVFVTLLSDPLHLPPLPPRPRRGSRGGRRGAERAPNFGDVSKGEHSWVPACGQRMGDVPPSRAEGKQSAAIKKVPSGENDSRPLLGAGSERRSAAQVIPFAYDVGVKTPGLFTPKGRSSSMLVHDELVQQPIHGLARIKCRRRTTVLDQQLDGAPPRSSKSASLPEVHRSPHTSIWKPSPR